MRNITLSTLIEMALEQPPMVGDGVEPVLLFMSTDLETNQKSYYDDLEENLIGKFIDDTVFKTSNGWSIIIIHAIEISDVRARERTIRERQDYHVVETWLEMTIKKEKLPILLEYLDKLMQQQTRH